MQIGAASRDRPWAIMKAHSTPGKNIGQRTYFHIEAGAELNPAWIDRWNQAERLAGVARAEHYNLVRIDVDGPCVALLNYPDFFAEPFPALRESWLVNLEQGTVAYRTYADSLNPPILHRKELLLPADHPRRAEYAALTETAEAIGLFDQPTRIGYQRQWLALVREKSYRIEGHTLVPLGNVEDMDDGFELKRMQTIPDLEDACGAYLTYRQLIECGETWASTGLDNQPRQPDSYTALLELTLNILDPVIDYFGMIRLTYGFCSPALARRIPGRIDPKRDQHAAHEVNRQNRLICERLGAAVDFIVEDENMLEAAQWIAANTPFDRLYFYDVDQPIHVSFGPNHDRQVVCMFAAPSGRLTPRVIPREQFLALTEI